MSTFYCINRDERNATTVNLLQNSATERGIDFSLIDSTTFDYTQKINIEEGDILYNVCVDENSKNVERMLLNDKCLTFYKKWEEGVHNYDNVIEASIVHQRYNLRVIDTIYNMTKDRKVLERYVDVLGGFPVVIKMVNGSHGIGVVKVDSFDALFSIVDVFVKNNFIFVMRKYIDYKEHARLIVIGDAIVSSIEYKKIGKDFRSNVGEELNVCEKKYPEHIKELAIKATNVLGFEFGGVDILIDNDDTAYIAEVNFPCFFPRAQLETGTDISGKMIEYLVTKCRYP